MTTALLKTLDVDENAISYDEHGERTNPTVVLLTGWCQDHRLFDPLVPRLAADHHIVRIDWRGYGADRRPAADFGPAEQASDAIAVLDALGGSPLARMAAMRENRPIKHLFSQHTDPGYEVAQADFQTEHPWFSYRNLRGETHSPTLDSPQLVAAEVRARATGR
ncbi:alpha/beta fold hydrolase [Saccharopolyspora sp. NPDC050389]|uniref:alpha/beta fold hydrolase n=1 Tax=Saccharopolyspora sp. NPDC050389 TaxID=3155516 RepID=UPI0033E11511